jgi:hypothetical protein
MKNINIWLLSTPSKLIQILCSSWTKEGLVIKALLLIILLHLSTLSFSQTADSTQIPDSTSAIRYFSSAVSITNNGISLVPTFSLGKPAAIVNLLMGTRRMTFEPDLRVSLEGKPWSFVFWGRYKVLTNNRFRLNVGAHPAINFATETVSVNGGSREMIVAQRFLAGEVVPYYLLTKNISIGMYYLYGRGLEANSFRNGHFITLNSNFSNVRLSNQLYMQFTPQVFYLKLDEQDGFYVTSTVTLSKRNFPFSLQSIINKTIKSNIAGSKDLVWNATLIYSFNKEYVVRNQRPF